MSTMTAKARRDAVRWVHIVVGLALGTYVYLPLQYDGARDVLRLALMVVGIPLITLTGLWLWKGAAVRRALRSRASRSPDATPASS